MKVYKIVFSPTGGTEKVATIIADALGKGAETVDISQNGFSGCEIPPDSVSVIAVPSFGGRAPKVAADRLRTIKANESSAIVVAVYGNREQEDTLIEIADIAKECGFVVIAGIEAIAEHSIAHQYATGRPDGEDRAQLEEFVKKITGKPDGSPEIPGNRPYKKAGAGLVPKGNSSCNGCGLCVKKCPVGAIDGTDPKKTDKTACINCMRCVAVCPKKARNVNPVMVGAVGVALKKSCSGRKENKLYI